jgi:hypothetical protein
MRGSNKQWDYKLGKPMGVTYIFVYNFQRYLYLVHVITLYYNIVKAQHACLLMLSYILIAFNSIFSTMQEIMHILLNIVILQFGQIMLSDRK